MGNINCGDTNTTMKIVIILSLLGAAIAAPQRQTRQEEIVHIQQDVEKQPPLLILKDERSSGQDGAYTFQFETENGNPGASGGATASGTHSYVLDDGSVQSVEYL